MNKDKNYTSSNEETIMEKIKRHNTILRSVYTVFGGLLCVIGTIRNDMRSVYVGVIITAMYVFTAPHN